MTRIAIGSVRALWRYPVKSMGGERLEAAELAPHGILGDRAYAIVGRADGRVASAKAPARWGRLFACRAAYVEPSAKGRGLGALRIALADGRTVWSDDEDVAARLSRALGEEVALAGPRIDAPFFDAEPIHLLSTATLAHLASRYPQGHFDPRRFRPNLLVALASELPAFAEERWVGCTIAVGEEARLRIVSPCERCVMTTLAQADLAHDPAILQTVVRHNRSNAGVYAEIRTPGRIRRGDALWLV
jgi:uncharacterized protein YcbX